MNAPSLNSLVAELASGELGNLFQTFQREIGSKGENGPCVYYLAHYKQIRRILDSGLILPRNALAGHTNDLSSPGVQNRRNAVWLGNGLKAVYPPREAHHCLNFFLNPVNPTLHAFCRNQIIGGEEGIRIGILEIPLQRIADHMQRSTYLWAFTDRNLARGGRTCSNTATILQSLRWPQILSTEDRYADEVFAEFIMWHADAKRGPLSLGLPVSLVSAILCNGDFPAEVKDPPVILFRKFRSLSTLLVAESKLAEFVAFYGDLIGFADALAKFPDAVKQLPITLIPDTFRCPDLACQDMHGIPHVLRVMFWAFVLSSKDCLSQMIPGWTSDCWLRGDTLLAAALHDLERASDREDATHGAASVTKYQELISSYCKGQRERIHRIEEAITWHCRPDADCPDPSNPIWRLLKDADGLDRGRFNKPCEGSDFAGAFCTEPNCKHRGCIYRLLRLPYEKIASPGNCPGHPFRKRIAEAAWNLAASTRNAPWENYVDPSYYLKNWIENSQICLRKNGLPYPIKWPISEEDYAELMKRAKQ
jgi:hypothetical protein